VPKPQTKPRPETLTKMHAARDALIAESKAANPKATNHNPTAQQLGDRMGVSKSRASTLLAAAGLPSHKVSIVPVRADVSRPIPKSHGGVARIVVANLRALYKAELAKPSPRSDAALAKAAGFAGRPDTAAARFRKVIAGTGAPPSLAVLERFAAAFGVEVEALVKKRES
jgi:hypothetical protein